MILRPAVSYGIPWTYSPALGAHGTGPSPVRPSVYHPDMSRRALPVALAAAVTGIRRIKIIRHPFYLYLLFRVEKIPYRTHLIPFKTANNPNTDSIR